MYKIYILIYVFGFDGIVAKLDSKYLMQELKSNKKLSLKSNQGMFSILSLTEWTKGKLYLIYLHYKFGVRFVFVFLFFKKERN